MKFPVNTPRSRVVKTLIRRSLAGRLLACQVSRITRVLHVFPVAITRFTDKYA